MKLKAAHIVTIDGRRYYELMEEGALGMPWLYTYTVKGAERTYGIRRWNLTRQVWRLHKLGAKATKLRAAIDAAVGLIDESVN